MARHKLKISQIESKNLKPGKYGDGDSLWLHCKKSTRSDDLLRSWVFIWRRGGRRVEMGLGRYGTQSGEISLTEARARADEARDILKNGGDPRKDMQHRKAHIVERTFGECLIDAHTAILPTFRNPKHATQWRTSVEAYGKSLLKLSIKDIGTDDIVRVLKPIWREKPETASRVRGRIEKVLDYAKARGLRDGENPARLKGHLDHLLGKRVDKVQHFAAVNYSEVPTIIAELSAQFGYAARALEFTIFTAARTSETIEAEWSEFDLDALLWTIPASRMKAKQEHIVPLNAGAVSVLKFMERHRQSDLIFPGRKPAKPMSNMSMLKILKGMGRTETVHGFRSSFRDWAGEETSFPREIAEQALAHTVGDKVEQAYRRGTAIEKRRKLMDAWAAYILPAQSGVVKLHG